MSISREWLKVFDIPKIGDVLVRLDHDQEASAVAVIIEWLDNNCENGCCPDFTGTHLVPVTSNLSKVVFDKVDREAAEGIVREVLRMQGKKHDFLKEDKRPDSITAHFVAGEEFYTENALEVQEGGRDINQDFLDLANAGEQGFLEFINAFNGAIDSLPEQERELLTKISDKVESLVDEKITENKTGVSQKLKH